MLPHPLREFVSIKTAFVKTSAFITLRRDKTARQAKRLRLTG
jgi:hypothetical protein